MFEEFVESQLEALNVQADLGDTRDILCMVSTGRDFIPYCKSLNGNTVTDFPFARCLFDK